MQVPNGRTTQSRRTVDNRRSSPSKVTGVFQTMSPLRGLESRDPGAETARARLADSAAHRVGQIVYDQDRKSRKQLRREIKEASPAGQALKVARIVAPK